MKKIMWFLTALMSMGAWIAPLSAEEIRDGIFVFDPAVGLEVAAQAEFASQGGVLLTQVEGDGCELFVELDGESLALQGEGVVFAELFDGPKGSTLGWRSSCAQMPPQVVLFVGDAAAYVSESPESYWQSVAEILSEAKSRSHRVSSLLTH